MIIYLMLSLLLLGLWLGSVLMVLAFIVGSGRIGSGRGDGPRFAPLPLPPGYGGR